MTDRRPQRIACLGEAMIELALDGDMAVVGFAGDVLNAAIYLRRALPDPHSVSFVSLVGRDPLSDRMVERIEAEGVDTDHIARHENRIPGAYAIITDDHGERSFVYWRDTSAARTLFMPGCPIQPETLAGFDVLHLSAITLAILTADARRALIDWLPAFRAGGGRVAFDSNYRPRLWPDVATAQAAVTDLWRLTDIGFPSVDDEMALFGDADAAAVLARIEGAGVATGALKCGEAGPLPIGARLPGAVYAPAPRVVDTTAAGDSFTGGYLAAHLTGASQADALQAGHATASHVIGHRGAIVPR
ncbi:sugar kinase [Jannaschia rubra]|uniref:sugar kinase n=1 Tax=Jannaschia rubra TaxID=282197 RepID=UPI00248F51DD|nr:sugar kinase [Jannaschia rubra]